MFGFIGAALGAVGSFISGAVSTVGSICSKIGGSIMGGIHSLANGMLRTVVADKQPGLFEMIQQITGLFGIGRERPDEMGMKVEQSGEKPEDFDSIQAYIDHLHKDIQVDQEKLDKLSDMDRVAYGAIGSALCVKGMEEKCGMELPIDFWKVASKVVHAGKLSDKGMKHTLDGMKERGVKSAESFSNYMDGKASMEEQMAVYDSLKEALHKEFPDLSDADLNVKVTNIKDFIEQDKK